MLATFNKALYFLFEKEGGTNTDPVDRGGYTNFGISEKQYGKELVKKLNRGTAAKLYYNDYWLKNKCNAFQEPLAIVLFDSSVNCGQSSAGIWLQLTCNRLGDDLKVDGIIGVQTLTAARKHDSRTLLEGVVAYRLKRYSSLIKAHPEQIKYVRGWMERAADLLLYVK